MATTRRTFLKTTLIAGAGASLPSLPAFAATGEPAASSATLAGAFTRGVGVYPGAPGEFFCPTFDIDIKEYRNLALLRPATASSSYDYNLTPQLVTDGIKDKRMPRWIASATSTEGILPKQQRESLLDHWPAKTLDFKGGKVSAYVQIAGGVDVPEIDRIAVFVVVAQYMLASRITISLAKSDDGSTWEPIGSLTGPAPIDGTITFPPDLNHGNHLYYPSIQLDKAHQSRFYQVTLAYAGVTDDDPSVNWRLGQMEFYKGSRRENIGGPYSFTSAWMSAGLDEEWVAVDLGAMCTFDKVTLSWIARAAEGSIQVSSNGETWRTVKALPKDATGQIDEIHLAPAVRARHVRVMMTRPSAPAGYILSEFEVFGRGGPVAKSAPAQKPTEEGNLLLAGGNWKLQRETQVEAPGVAISKPGFSDADWVIATVPGTILTSYLNVGAIPDPNYGENQLAVSDSFFYADFWYRNTFTAPAAKPGQIQWLNFAGIDWKAEVFLNGEAIGHIDGGFIRGRFNVTGKLLAGAENVLAVRVIKNATPGSCKQKTLESPGPNGGALGADNATFHSSIGWDWIPTIRGRNTGIWGEVSIETTGVVTVDNPLVTSVLGKGTTADVILATELWNHSNAPVSGSLRGKFGEFPFDHPVTLPAGARQEITLAPLNLPEAKLWWPVGYGDPHLYDVELEFVADGQTTDTKKFKSGVRQMTATEDGGRLRLFINGRRFIPRGGNWGFAESMLRYRAREYDVAVRYHKEMNFTMIRNWVGQVPDDAFFEACDRHGLVVWQDFWLANPWDGPIPDDNALWLANARDTILRIRRHASIGLYCGRNEWFPPPALDAGIRALIKELHPDIHYIGSSADNVVSGHGPYRALPPKFYFEHADLKFHSEIGMPNIPPIESVRMMMPESEIWPQSLSWGLHDFCLTGAQGGTSFRGLVNDGYGGAKTAEEWMTLAQFINFEGYRAMFEAQSRDRMGVLLWMSHPCWPSFVWQTYDFYFEPTSAYFACKTACEPLHIQWNRLTGHVEVVNLSGGNRTGLAAKLEILNMDGMVMSTLTATVDSPEDSVNPAIDIAYPAGLTPVHFLRLTLSEGAKTISTNFYLRGHDEGNYRAIRELPKVKLEAATTVTRQNDTWMLSTEVHNPTATPALMVRLKAVRETAGDRILPAIYSDNYINVMPGEKRTVTTELAHADTRGQKPKILVSGFNVLDTPPPPSYRAKSS
jgi:hypothetical protein